MGPEDSRESNSSRGGIQQRYSALCVQLMVRNIIAKEAKVRALHQTTRNLQICSPYKNRSSSIQSRVVDLLNETCTQTVLLSLPIELRSTHKGRSSEVR